MTGSIADAYLAALAMMEQTGPRDLHRTASVLDPDPKAADETLQAYLSSARADDALRRRLLLSLATWDQMSATAWTENTDPNTDKRREIIVRLLQVDDMTAKLFAEHFPVVHRDGDIVIADSWVPWYTDRLRQERDFYWHSYRKLLGRKRWDPEAIASLDVATNEVIERLSDPTRSEAYQAKGLVVGYVQSGKTANFTGVVAKAIDAGYRLVIVLTGTTDLLRGQTQRRLDMELVGVENVLRGVDPNDQRALDDVDYQDDPDWRDGRFLKHGVWPPDVDRPAIDRLTSHAGDYRSLKQGIAALDFPKRDRTRPFFASVNLYAGDAKLAVVKKNARVLEKLVRDLKKITARLGEIPVLIIDDESDQASVNTSNPKLWADDQKDRTAINRHISELLRMLPRAQYVGYTATPFANVFIDPSDAEDIFPKDFLISLRRPPGYMGASDFHDLDVQFDYRERTIANSRKLAHVRLIDNEVGDDRALLEAMDAFVLAGAVKLYRESQGFGTFRHHTMLVHEAMKIALHKERAEGIRMLWTKAGYYSPSSRERLRALFENDTASVARAIGEDLPTPSFEELFRYISQAVARIGQTGDPVLVVNSDKDVEREELDFDRSPVWRILVGGNKLARGFTVEGLTVSYYRRVTKQADTMMQMGRWFGFRKHYRDLVRLYITPELYEALEAIVLDEEYFRTELRRYATPVDGEPQIIPKQIPPLVAQHLPWLKPTGTNKMYNAVLTERRSPGIPIEPRAYPSEPSLIEVNTRAFLPSLAAADRTVRFGVQPSTYEARIGIVPHTVMVDVLDALAWAQEDVFEPDMRWIRRLNEDQVKDWVVILPQHVRHDQLRGLIGGHGPLSLFRRNRVRPGYFSAISESRHRPAAERIAGDMNRAGDPQADRLAAPKRGAMVVYPVIEKGLELDGVLGTADKEIPLHDVVMAFHLLTPRGAISMDRRLVTFTTLDSARRDAVIIDTRASDSVRPATTLATPP
jgi:hypothetical protein